MLGSNGGGVGGGGGECGSLGCTGGRLGGGGIGWSWVDGDGWTNVFVCGCGAARVALWSLV